jgi:hypothetical protein
MSQTLHRASFVSADMGVDRNHGAVNSGDYFIGYTFQDQSSIH